MTRLPGNLTEVIYISGKTSTGKSTLSHKIANEHSYAIIELDEVIYSLKSKPNHNRFIESYIERDNTILLNEFVNTVVDLIESALKYSPGVAVEGAIANIQTFHEIFGTFKEQLSFVYIHPKNIDEYIRRLTLRFAGSELKNGNGLPGKFWNKMTSDSLNQYYKDRIITPKIHAAIESYAKESINESKERLKAFKHAFPKLHVIEI